MRNKRIISVPVNTLRSMFAWLQKEQTCKKAIMAVCILFCTIANIRAQNEPYIVIDNIPRINAGGVAEGRVVWNGLAPENTAQYAIIAMLRASWGDDYVKPTNDDYLSAINASGRFSVNITTGGSGDYAIDDVSFFLVRRETFNGVSGGVVKYETMSNKYLGKPLTINRTSFWANRLSSPKPNIMPGFVPAGRNITLSCEAGESIKYTIDGSNPVTSSTARNYTLGTSFNVPAEGSLLVKAVVTKSGAYSPPVSLLWFPQESLKTPFFGLNVSLALNGEVFGHNLSEKETRERLEPVAKLTKWIRTYGTLNNGLPYINRIAKDELNLRTMIGLYITNNDFDNKAQIEGLKRILEAGSAPDLITVGNECSLLGVSSETLEGCIDAVRELLISKSLAIAIGSVDIAGSSLSSSVLDKLDFIGTNIFSGTWDATPENSMFAKMKQSYAAEIAKYQPKMVFLTETGTPYSGGSYAVDGITITPSIAKATAYLSGFIKWIQEENVPAFYFEAFDEKTKSTQTGGHPIEQYFGIMDGDMKIHSFYEDAIMKYITSNPSIPAPDKAGIIPYPNPVRDAFTINNLPPGLSVEIYNMSGKLVKSQYLSILQNNNITINIANLPDGMYLVKAGELSCKIIKDGK